MTELKPCPFCGCSARVTRSPEAAPLWIVEHDRSLTHGKCPLDMALLAWKTEDEAVASWNQRWDGDGQPFSFTREDVEMLRGIAKSAHLMMENRPDGYWSNDVANADNLASNLADRIEALLPPDDHNP